MTNYEVLCEPKITHLSKIALHIKMFSTTLIGYVSHSVLHKKKLLFQLKRRNKTLRTQLWQLFTDEKNINLKNDTKKYFNQFKKKLFVGNFNEIKR